MVDEKPMAEEPSPKQSPASMEHTGLWDADIVQVSPTQFIGKDNR